MPLALSETSQPEPDVSVVPAGSYRAAHPDRAYLVIEVAGSSLHKDRELKGPLYAAAGIPEYWVVDLESRRVIVHRNPEGGAWRSRRSFGAKATLSLLRFPDVGVELRNVFGS